MTTEADILLKARGVTKRFEGLVALGDLNLDVQRGSIHGVIGPNGAGKTTFFNVLTGFYSPDEGTIEIEGRRVDWLKPHQIAAVGVSRTFQNIRLFANMTALENILVGDHMAANIIDSRPTPPRGGKITWRMRVQHGGHHLRHPGEVLTVPIRWGWEVWSTIARTPSIRHAERDAVARSAELLTFVGLRPRSQDLARNLSYGDQRRLELARALATRPKLLLLDEPAAGMNPQEGQGMMELIREIRNDLGVTVILIEHQMRVVMGVCEKITVLDYGRKISEGTPAEVQKDPKVIEAYLGQRLSGTNGNGKTAEELNDAG